MEYSLTELLLGGVIIFVAYLVRGIAGFGSGLIAIPLLALMFPLSIVVPIVVILDLLGSGAQAIKSRAHTNWRCLYPLFPMTLAGILCAMFFFKNVEMSSLKLALGLFVMAFALYQLLPTPELRAGSLTTMPLGFFGGLLGTLFGVGGPFYVIYFTLTGLDKSSFRASYSMYFLIDGLFRITAYIVGLSLLTGNWAWLFLYSLPPFMAGLYAGGRVHHDISPVLFKRLISLILLASGSALILQN